MLDVTAARAAVRQLLTVKLGNEVQVVVGADQLTPPCLLIGMPTITYQGGAQGFDQAEWPLFAILPRTHDEAAVERADRWIAREGPESVRAILMEDQTWGGTIAGLFVRTAVAEIYEGPTGQLPDYRWDLEVVA